jgi:IclR family pca regulon transcriptional regulator
LVDQEVEIGLRSIAVPVYTPSGRIIAALNTGVAAINVDPLEIVDLYLPELLEAQAGLRRLLR